MSKINLEAINKVSRSGYLTSREYVILHTALKIPFRREDALLICRPSHTIDRVRFWIRLLESSTDDPTQKKIPESISLDASTDYYRESISKITPNGYDREGSTTEQFGEIERDVSRTFQEIPIFAPNSLGEAMLTRLLKVICYTTPDIGYCQGMNFVAALILMAKIPKHLIMIDSTPESMDVDDQITVEAEVYRLITMMVEPQGKLAMIHIWRPGVAKMKFRVYQFDKLLERHIPNLHRHFHNIHFAPEILVSQWFITLFAYAWSYRCIYRLWDFIFYGGLSAVYRIALAILVMLEPALVKLDLEGVCCALKDDKTLLELYYGLNNRLQMLMEMHSIEQRINETSQTMNQNAEIIEISEKHETQFVEDILWKARHIVVNGALLDKLQESFAIEMIEMSQVLLQKYLDVSCKVGSPNKSTFMSMFAGKMEVGDVGHQTSQSNIVLKDYIERRALKTNSWFMQYANEMTLEEAEKLDSIKTNLEYIDKEIESDHEKLQESINKACDNCRICWERCEELSRSLQTYNERIALFRKELDDEVKVSNLIIEKLQKLWNKGMLTEKPPISEHSDIFPDDIRHAEIFHEPQVYRAANIADAKRTPSARGKIRRFVKSLFGSLVSSPEKDSEEVDEYTIKLQEVGNKFIALVGTNFDISCIYETFAFKSFFEYLGIDNDLIMGNEGSKRYSQMQSANEFIWDQTGSHELEIFELLSRLNLNDHDFLRLAVSCKKGHKAQQRILFLHRSISELEPLATETDEKLQAENVRLQHLNDKKTKYFKKLSQLMHLASRSRKKKLDQVTEMYF